MHSNRALVLGCTIGIQSARHFPFICSHWWFRWVLSKRARAAQHWRRKAPSDSLSLLCITTNRFHVLNRVRNRRHSGFQLTKRGLQAHGSGSVEFQNSNSNEHADHDSKHSSQLSTTKPIARHTKCPVASDSANHWPWHVQLGRGEGLVTQRWVETNTKSVEGLWHVMYPILKISNQTYGYKPFVSHIPKS